MAMRTNWLRGVFQMVNTPSAPNTMVYNKMNVTMSARLSML
jgi:hypothetical protein